jgi:hypothetical protein
MQKMQCDVPRILSQLPHLAMADWRRTIMKRFGISSHTSGRCYSIQGSGDDIVAGPGA